MGALALPGAARAGGRTLRLTALLLLLKLTLSPLFICGVTLAVRRWGMGIGGWVASLPVNGGPILLFFCLEQGNAFGANAARFTLVSIMGVGLYSLAYAWLAQRMHWTVCLMGAWVVFFAAMFLLRDWNATWPVMLAASVTSLLVCRHLLPAARKAVAMSSPTRWDLPMRLATAIVLVLVLTYLADMLGARWSGLLTAFPIASTVIAGFTHARQGPDAAINFFRGMLAGMPGFCLFCAVLVLALVPLHTFSAFLLAILAQMGAHAFGLMFMRRHIPA